jgi:hypothetical protein
MSRFSKLMKAALLVVPGALILGAFSPSASADQINDTVTYTFTGPDAAAGGTELKAGNTIVGFAPNAPGALTTATPTALTFGGFTVSSSDTTLQTFSLSDKFVMTIVQNGTLTKTVTASVSGVNTTTAGSIDQDNGLLTVAGFTPGTFTLGLDTYFDFSQTQVSPPSAFSPDTVTGDVTAASGVPLPATVNTGLALLAGLGLAGFAKRSITGRAV